MRKTAFLAAVAAALCTVACNKDFQSQAPVINGGDGSEAAETAQLKLSVVGNGGVQTKTIDSGFDDSHSAVDNIQFFVFDGDVLDVYKKITDGLSTSITVKTGSKTVWAVVNAPVINTVKTLTELKALTSNLSDNTAHFVMVGSTTAEVPSDDPVEIEVKRIVSRVIVKKVTASFTNPAYNGISMTLKKIYLINVPKDINLEMTNTPLNWYSKRAYEDPTGIGQLFNSDIDQTFHTAPYTTSSYHYCYPNPTVADSQDATWSPRHTRVVLDVLFGAERFYYPITLPVLEPGKSYEIENVTITRKGSSDPDQPVSLSEADFEISVKDWTVVPVTEGITI